MKRLIIIVLLGSMFSVAFGQFYVQPSVGYAFSSHPTERHSIFITDNRKSVYTMKFRWSENMNAGLTIGYELWDQLFLELNARMAVFSRHSASIEIPDLQSLDNFMLSGFFGEIEYSSPVFQFAPQVGYKVRRDKFSAYFSIGPNFMQTSIRMTTRSEVYEFLNWADPMDKVTQEVYRGKLHTGLQSDLGVCYAVSPKLHFVLDFVTAYNNYKITDGEYTLYEIDGADQLVTEQDKEIQIYPGYDRLNHSHYGVNVGLRYFFGRMDQSQN